MIESEKPTDEGKKPSNEEKKPESLEKDKEGTNDVDTNDRVQVSRREVSSVTSKEAGKNAKTGVVGVYNTLGALSMAAIALEASKKKKEEDDN